MGKIQFKIPWDVQAQRKVLTNGKRLINQKESRDFKSFDN